MVKWESFNAITCNGKRHISPRYVSSGCRSIWFLELVLEEIAFSMGDLEALLLVEVMLVQNQHDTWRCILSPDAIYNHLVTKFASHMQNIQDSNPILGNFGTVLPLWKCLFFLGDYFWIDCQLNKRRIPILNVQQSCSFCRRSLETAEHLFRQCRCSSLIWQRVF